MLMTTYTDLHIFQQQLTQWLEIKFSRLIEQQNYFTVFISYGNRTQRCKVWSNTDNQPKKIVKRSIEFFEKMFKQDRCLPEFIKIDLAYNIEKKSWQDVLQDINQQKHNNHYRKGIGFNEDLTISFLEQEIYARSIIRSVIYNESNFVDEKNLNDAIQKKYPSVKQRFKLEKIKTVWTFDTEAVFYQQGQWLDLKSTGCENGVRCLIEDRKQHIKSLILKNAQFLHREILADGQFIYGYFPAFDREIKSYNTVRHCTAIYALLETLEVEYNINYLEKIEQSIHYAIHNFYKTVDKNKAFMIDLDKDRVEIKLGSNAAAIFMFAKYQEITKDNQYQHYAEALAEGIRSMIDQNGETTHVLDYPSLQTKEKFRIVYYDGEAALGLLRLYQINGDPILLDTVKLMFEHFISKKYDKYHDHWLSYCTNELTKICPEEKYFQFGLNNYLKHMKFIRERKTAYATFLEMMMSAYKMVLRMKEQGFTELYESAKFDELKQLIELRVEFQRATGFFYPEVAMYMAKPEKILNAFYVRHDRFRTRIDDQEHNLSGYVAYMNFFESNK